MLNKVLCKTLPKDKKKWQELIEVSQPLLQKLEEILEEELEKLDFVEDEDFDNPSWALKQAYKVGYKKGLTRLKDYGIIGMTKIK